MSVINVEHISKLYGDKMILEDLSCSVDEGDKIGIIGINGTGKSTLLRIIAGEEEADEGKIIFSNGMTIGWMGQNPEFDEESSILKYVCEGKKIEDDYGYESDAKAMLTVLELENFDEKIKNLSGGQKKRAALCKVLLQKPDILILDEPTAGLDPKERVRFRNLISAFSKDRIVILSTHIVSDVEFIAEEIIMMKSGQIIHFGNPQEITSEIDGQVWECTVPTAYAEKYAAAYNTSNLRNTSENQTILRIIGDRPPMENAVRVQPTLEDLYLFYFKGGCEE